MRPFAREEEIEKEFHVSRYIVAYKFLLGVVELLAGLAIAFFGSRLLHLYQTSLMNELLEDLLAHFSEAVVPNVLTHSTFIVLSLIILGVAKIVGSIGLIYKRNWGVDLLVGLTILMAPFQVVNLILHPRAVDILYFAVGLVIALYLMEFRPKAWISRVLGFG
jgi:uncharacterized membrane protein (DUF2068 family)